MRRLLRKWAKNQPEGVWVFDRPGDSAPGPPGLERVRVFEGDTGVLDLAWSTDGAFMGAINLAGEVGVWSDEGYRLVYSETGSSSSENSLAWHPTRPLLCAAISETIILWNAAAEVPSRLGRLNSASYGISWSPDGRRLAIADEAGGIGIWDVENSTRLQHAHVHEGPASSVCWTPDGMTLVTGGYRDAVIHVLNARDLRVSATLQGHASSVGDVTMSSDGRLIASSSADKTVRVWDLSKRQPIAVLEGHLGSVLTVRFSPDASILASLSLSTGLSVWNCRGWGRVATYRNGANFRHGLAFHPVLPLLAAKTDSAIDCFSVDYDLLRGAASEAGSRRYGNAKVVLIGDTGVGKSGLGLVLSGREYKPTDSTHGRNVWVFGAEEAAVSGGGMQTRETLLWDLAGQPGYRLIHQLHLNEVAVALIVFDARSETDPFSGVKYWARALAQARKLEGTAATPMKAYLVAARADRGGVGVSAERVRAMVADLGLDGFFETSAKEGWQVAELTDAIRGGIDWDALPMISSSVLFDSIKQFLIEEKQQGRLLCTADDLFHGFRRTHPDQPDGDALRASFETCIGRVESRGLIRRLRFGGLVLLQPELLDAYASGMVQAARAEPDGLGFIAEEDALAGRFGLAESERVADKAQERLLLIATVEELLRHEIALKEITDRGMDLVFPSQFTRERPDAPDIPGKEVTFSFEGPLHNIYATLAVRLSHSALFERRAMWQSAASYAATVGGTCGIHLREIEEGRGELVLFYDEQASRSVRSQFETYVADHLRLRVIPGTLTRRVIRTCPNCGYVLPEDLVRRRLDRGAVVMRCPDCEAAEITLSEEPAAPADVAVATMNRSADERRDQNAAELRLKGKIETGDYDVFLCYNSRDKEQVAAIGERLRERGILPWLDVREIPPGTRWQKELQKYLKSVRSAAVFIGAKGPGPWQGLEVESLLKQIAGRNRPIIPVILEGRVGNPRLPAFLDLWNVVDMRQPEPDPFEMLVWGITGEKPTPF